ncbi:MAG TPA: NHL repeat-containing protein [Phycisphaerae bacterium]|nr:NHL repeat-containing protein [Phycisphaerae bacterium]
MKQWKPSGLGPEFTYDLSELRKVDPTLVHYKQTGSVPTGMAKPRGIAVGADGRLFVAGEGGVRIFDAAGKPVAPFETGGEPHCIAVGKTGTVYVGMKDHVEVYDASGKRAAAWNGLGERAYVTSLAVGEAYVFVADAGNRVLLRYDLSGKLLNRIGEADEAKHAPGLIVPSPYFDVALGPKGMLWLVNPGRRRVECYTYEGAFRFAWGEFSMKIEGFCGCCNPTHLAIDRQGNFITSEKGLPRVKVYDDEGNFTSVVAAPADFADGAVGLDVAVDTKGRILVLDPKRGDVRIFAKKRS